MLRASDVSASVGVEAGQYVPQTNMRLTLGQRRLSPCVSLVIDFHDAFMRYTFDPSFSSFEVYPRCDRIAARSVLHLLAYRLAALHGPLLTWNCKER